MATPDKNLHFIRERMLDIGSALFYSFSEALLKLPVSIVNILEMDDEGHVWFFVHKPAQEMSSFEQEFFSELQFRRKGTSHRINVKGRACLLSEDETYDTLLKFSRKNLFTLTQHMTLVKLKIQQADYYEPSRLEERGHSFFKKLYEKWFSNKSPFQPMVIHPTA